MAADPWNMLAVTLPMLIACVLLLPVLYLVYLLCRHWVHPARTVVITAQAAAVTMLIGLTLNPAGVVWALWLTVPVLVLAGLVVACLRARLTDPPQPQDPANPRWGERRGARFAARPGATMIASTAAAFTVAVVLGAIAY
jgi:hypothetical protein